MSREILFRGKRLDNGGWETGSLIIIRWGCSDAWHYITDKMTGYPTPIDPATVGQFTGLCDKNGKKIFEGDIVKMVPDDNEEESWITEVKFEDGAFRVEVNGCDYVYTVIGWIDDDVETEVIGNIHDNPELLEEKSE